MRLYFTAVLILCIAYALFVFLIATAMLNQ
jgi:hypothetical protein